MRTSPPRRLRLALLSACCFGLVFASLATGEARANDCSINNVFQMSVVNVCNGTTTLQGSALNQLTVKTSNIDGYAVTGVADSPTGATKGVFGATASASTLAAGVTGGVLPPNNTTTTGSYSAGVFGFNSGTNFGGFGVYGIHGGQGIGVYGEAPSGFAVSGYSPNNWSGYFQGSVSVVGTLYKSSGAFRIDHPLDPAHKYVQHSFVESPDMMNVYNGNVVTNSKGFATVKLPAYFQALNKDFRYQLTSLSGLQDVAVANRIANNRFTIQSEHPHAVVSWQVTGIRRDAYANAHRIQTVVPKQGKAGGRYVHPELYGKPLAKSVVVLPGMRPGTKPKLEAPTVPTTR